MNDFQTRLSHALYLERYAAGHAKGCDMSLQELRSNVFTKCSCGLLQERSKKEAKKDEYKDTSVDSNRVSSSDRS